MYHNSSHVSERQTLSGSETLTTWPCPGCGAEIGMPPGCRRPLDAGTEKLDKLAHVLCGCWVMSQSDVGTHRLLSAIIHARDPDDPPKRRCMA
jgi:predicted RNA-binding Zn-ribbon protein involved in translation (DUF1610 family)